MPASVIKNTAIKPIDFNASSPPSSLRADQVSKPHHLTIYIPNKDANGRSINVNYWIAATTQLLAHKFGGVSLSPPNQGVWLNPETFELIEETTYKVCVFVERDDLLRHGSLLASHIKKFGRETGQGEVLVRLDEKLLRYTQF